MPRVLAVALGSIVIAVASNAQQTRPSPLTLAAVDETAREVRYEPDAAVLRELLGRRAYRWRDVMLPGGELVDLELERIDHERHRFGFRVDGERRPDLLENLDLTLWSGHVVGAPDSEVMLSFSNVMSGGWIRHAGDVVHLLPQRGEDGWRDGGVLAITEAERNARGEVLRFDCRSMAEPGTDPGAPPAGLDDLGEAFAPGGGWPKECAIALETDYQLFQVFGDLDAATVYVTTLLSFVGDRYVKQAETVMTFPYLQFYTEPDDPWNAQDQGGSCIDVLYEFQAAWNGKIPENARLGHMMSGANLGCGVAWVDVLCDNTYNFSVSGNIDGNVNFPVQQQSYNWDFMVVAHEIGHNFRTWHTHDYCPEPLDECPPQQYWGSCQDETLCIDYGTIMSYCHLCSGGTGNITTWFHTTVSDVITSGARDCLPDLPADQVMTSNPAPMFLPDIEPSVSVAVHFGEPQGPVRVHYRYGGGPFASIDLKNVSGNSWSGSLPVPACGDEPEFYFAFDDPYYGTICLPNDAPTDVFRAFVGIPVPEWVDDFEEDLGWTVEDLGATAGQWERGVPVGDETWPHAPQQDYDGSGSCWLTGNQPGPDDVDGGSVQLVSPELDLTQGIVLVSFAYWLTVENPEEGDGLVVEANPAGGLPNLWKEIATFSESTDGWQLVAFTRGQLLAKGFNPGPNSLFRFRATDTSFDGILEAAVDAFEVDYLHCDSIGQNYCGPATKNSTGQSGFLWAVGSEEVADNALVLTASFLPLQQFGYYITSQTLNFVPFAGGSQGHLCVGGVVGRFSDDIASTLDTGFLRLVVDLNEMPQPMGTTAVQPGETWHFQCWYRDKNPDPTSNFTDGVRILFK